MTHEQIYLFMGHFCDFPTSPLVIETTGGAGEKRAEMYGQLREDARYMNIRTFTVLPTTRTVIPVNAGIQLNRRDDYKANIATRDIKRTKGEEYHEHSTQQTRR
jgi:hypothetical protein